MKAKKLTAVVMKEKAGYSATVNHGEYFIATEGDTHEELKTNILEAINFTFEEEGTEYDLADIIFEYDLESFFHFYKVINAKALSQRIGMSQSLLAQYIRGIKKPSPAQKQRILNGVQQIGRELTEARFLM
ncbi:MAG: helix-turn-helix transcriptional regulator [Bacteroidota bacterium]